MNWYEDLKKAISKITPYMKLLPAEDMTMLFTGLIKLDHGQKIIFSMKY